MVNMTVAYDQRPHLAWIDSQQPDVVDQRSCGVSEVEQDGALLLVALRFQEERQSPLVVQYVAGVGAAAGPGAVVNYPVDRAAAQILIVHLVDQDADRQLV